MALIFLPTTHRPSARLAAGRRRFAFNDEVRIGGDSRVGRVTGMVAPKPHDPHVRVTFDDGSDRLVPERHVRAAKARLELLQGGAASALEPDLNAYIIEVSANEVRQ